MSRLRLVLLLCIVLVPTMTLIPLGSIWLWQHGLILTWAASAFLFTSLMYLVTKPMLTMPQQHGPRISMSDDANGSRTEATAWLAVDKYAAKIDPATIRSRDDFLNIAAGTVEAVAREYHPGDKSPIWHFTVPELLLLSERVSRRLRPIFIDSVPLAEQLSVAQMLRLYEWRSVAGVAGTAYDIWRLIRVANPISAVTHEARERVTKQILNSVRDDLAHRLATLVIREIAAVAIDLYSGRLRAIPLEPVEKIAPIALDADNLPRARSRLTSFWGEFRKMARGARAIYRRKPDSTKKRS